MGVLHAQQQLSPALNHQDHHQGRYLSMPGGLINGIQWEKIVD